MIAMEMVGMASRLTEQARQDASAKIDQWRRAIEVVRQAEKQAEMTVNLPPQLTAAANRAASSIRSADYVSAVGMAKQAIEARQQVLEIVSNAVTQEVSNRSYVLTQATGKLERIKKAHQSTIVDYKYPSLPEPPDTWGLVKTGFFTGIGVFVLWGIIACFSKSIPDAVQAPLTLLLIAFSFFGWLTIPILAWLFHTGNVGQIKKNMESKSKTAEATHNMTVPTLQKEVDKAKKELDKAMSAQRLLQAQ